MEARHIRAKEIVGSKNWDCKKEGMGRQREKGTPSNVDNGRVAKRSAKSY